MLIAGDIGAFCCSMPCNDMDTEVLDFVDDSGFVVFLPGKGVVRVYDVAPRAPELRREIKMERQPMYVGCADGKVRVDYELDKTDFELHGTSRTGCTSGAC